MPRLSSGRSWSALSCFQASCTSLNLWEASRLGSYVGELTIASTLPVDGSSATTEPCTFVPSARSPSNAASCALGSMVSATEPPLGWLLPSMSTTRLTNSRGSLPERISFWLDSTPERP